MSGSTAPNPQEDSSSPSNYSDKLASLLTFLEAHENELSNLDDDGREASVLPPGAAGAGGLADITNRPRTSEEKKALAGHGQKELKDQHDRSGAQGKARKGKPLVVREKKSYIWEEWEESSFLATLDDEHCEPEPRASSGCDAEKAKPASSNGLPPDAHQQLQELKSMSQAIATRAANLKVEMEQKTKVVEELHSIRIKNENMHVQRMKAAKQEWKQRLDEERGQQSRVKNEQETLKETLLAECKSLEEKISSVQSDTDKTIKSEREILERLRRDGAQDIEQAKRGWAQAEKNELSARDKRMSPKLKKDAAKAVEPKLKKLMEQNKEEIDRLEREAARELDIYKLEQYKRSNAEYKKETNKIRAEERKRGEKLERDWLDKLECSRRECETEVQRVRSEHEQRAKCMKQQFDADAQRCKDEHDVLLEEAKRAEALELEQARARHGREMVALEEKYSAKMAQKRKSCEAEFKECKARREVELRQEEEQRLADEQEKMRNRVQNEIDVVKQKLEEEKRQRREDNQRFASEKKRAIRQKHDEEIHKLEAKLELATNESVLLRQKEDDEALLLEDNQNKLSELKEALCEKEDQIMVAERRLASLADECNEQLANIQRDGERRVARAMNEKAVSEKALDRLLAERPKQQEAWASELDSLRVSHGQEVDFAESKIGAMLDSKNSILEEASARLQRLRQECVDVERALDEARRAKVLGHK